MTGTFLHGFVRCCIAAVTAATLLVGSARAQAADEVIDRVLAVASGEVITLSDVRAAIELGRVQAGNVADPTRVVLSQLIDRVLVLSEVDRFAPPEPSPVALDTAVDSVVARFPSPQAFEATLTRFGVDRDYVRELLREDLRIRAYLDQRFTADTPDQQRVMVDDWIAGLRRRAEVVDLYQPAVSAQSSGIGGPGRD
jgi:hypothetical protein